MILLKPTFLGVFIFADTSAASPVAQVTLRALFCSFSHGWFSTQSATAVQTRCPNVDVDTFQRDGIAGAAAREARRERAIVLGDPDGGVHVEAGVRPRKHPGGLFLVEECEAYEEPEHGATERLGQSCGVAGGPTHKGPVRPEPAVGDERVQVWMPVRTGTVCSQAGHDADSDVALARQRANGGGDGAGGDAGDLAGQAAPIETVDAQPLRDGEYHLPVRHGREQRRVEPQQQFRKPSTRRSITTACSWTHPRR